MRFSFLSVASALTAFAYGFTLEDAKGAKPAENTFAAGRYIVEFKEPDSLQLQTSQISALGYKVSVQLNYESPIFNGLSMDVLNDNTTTLEDLKNLPNVKNAWRASVITLDFEPASTNKPEWTPHNVTGVNKLHEMGYGGDDIVVAIVDSGVNYNHPALGGGLGPGFSVIGGYDFMEDPNNPSTDPMDCYGHGTFVSSVIVADTEVMVGVAPNAKVKMYKVFACSGSTTDDYVMAGLLKAYEEKPDVISLSLGSDRGYNNAPISLLAEKISETIPIVFAAGNSGEVGVMRASPGAAAKGAIAVAAVESKDLVAWPALVTSSSGETREITYVSNGGGIFDITQTFDVDVETNACFVKADPSHKGKFLLANRGACGDQFVNNYINGAGFAGAILFTSDIRYLQLDILENYNNQYMGLSDTDAGKWVYAQIQSGNTLKVSFDSGSDIAVKEKKYKELGQINYYTSWGPTFQNNFYPTVAAPGGKVIGANNQGGYYVASGTSFATPYMSGVIALYLGAFPGVDPQVLRNKIIASTNLLDKYVHGNQNGDDTSTLDTTQFAPLIQQGAGLIDVLRLFEGKTRILSKPYLELNDTQYRIDEHTISFINEDSVAVTYQITHTGMNAVALRDSKTFYPNSYYPPLVNTKPEGELSVSSLTLGPGQSGSVTVKILPPAGVDSSVAPVLQGYVTITGTNGDGLRVPYIGVETKTNDWTPLIEQPLVLRYDEVSGYLYDLDYQNYTFKPSAYDSPQIYYTIRYGTELFSFDIVDADYDLKDYVYPPVTGEKGYQGPVRTTPDVAGGVGYFPLEFPSYFTSLSFLGFQGFADGKDIPTGRYRILTRTIPMFGDKSKPEDWQLFLSKPFYIEDDDATSSSSQESSLTAQSSSSVSLSALSSSESLSSVVSSSLSSAVSSSAITLSSTSSQASSSSEAASSSASVSSSVPDVVSSTTADASMRTGSPLKNDVVPTGLNLITDISIKDTVTGSTDAFKGDLYEIFVTVKSKDRIPLGTSTQFTIPKIFYDFANAIPLLTSSGSAAGRVTTNADTNVFTIVFDTYFSLASVNIEGTFSFFAKLRYTENSGNFTQKRQDALSLDLSTPLLQPLIFVSSGNEYATSLKFGKYTTGKPHKFSKATPGTPTWNVYIPGPFDSVQIASSPQWNYVYDCALVSAILGSSVDLFGFLTSGESVGLVTSCGRNHIQGALTQSVPSGSMIRLTVSGEQSVNTFNSFVNQFLVQVTTAGTLRRYTLADTIYDSKVGVPDNYVFDGEWYVAPTSSSLLLSATSSAESSILSSSASSSESALASSSASSGTSSSASEASSITQNSSSASSSVAPSSEYSTRSGSPLRNDAVPTGPSLITDISIEEYETGSTQAFKGDLLEISVTVKSKDRIPSGTTTQFTIPKFLYGFPESFSLLTLSGGQAGRVTSDAETNVFTIEFDTVFSLESVNIEGTFTFLTKFRFTEESIEKREDTLDLSGPVVQPLVFVTPDNEYTSELTFGRLGAKPIKISSLPSDFSPVWDIYISGPFDSVELASYPDWNYAYDCSQLSGALGSTLDAFGLLVGGELVEVFESCGQNHIQPAFRTSVPTGSVLHIQVVGEQIIDGFNNYANSFLVAVTLDGTIQSYVLKDQIFSGEVGTLDNYVFDGQWYVAPTSSSSAESSSAETSSATTEDSSASQATSSSASSATLASSSVVSELSADVSTESLSSSVSSESASLSSAVSGSSVTSSGSSSEFASSSAVESQSSATSGSSALLQSSSVVSSTGSSSATGTSSATSSASTSQTAGISSSSLASSLASSLSGSASVSNPASTSLATAAPLRNPSLLTGPDLIRNITLLSNSTGSADGHKDHLFTVNVTVESTEAIASGTAVQFSVPEVFYGNLSPFDVYSTDGELVGSVSSDEVSNVFTLEFSSGFGLTHKNIRGSFTFNVKLRYTTALAKRALLTLDLSNPVVQPFVFITVGSEFASVITFADVLTDETPGEIEIGDVFVFIGELLAGGSSAILSSAVTSSTLSIAPPFSYGNSSVALSTFDTSIASPTNTASTTPTADPTGEQSTVVFTHELTVLVTVTSCSNHVCVPTTSVALVSTATTTIHGEVVIYTTYCPLTDNAGAVPTSVPGHTQGEETDETGSNSSSGSGSGSNESGSGSNGSGSGSGSASNGSGSGSGSNESGSGTGSESGSGSDSGSGQAPNAFLPGVGSASQLQISTGVTITRDVGNPTGALVAPVTIETATAEAPAVTTLSAPSANTALVSVLQANSGLSMKPRAIWTLLSLLLLLN